MLIAITGSIGAGKSTAAQYLQDTHGFSFSSGSKIIKEEVKKRGREMTRANMHTVANDLRSENKNGVMQNLLTSVVDAEDAVIGFIRTQSEVAFLKNNTENFLLLGIDAPAQLRFERKQVQGEYVDDMTFTEFQQFEEHEMTSTNSNEQNVKYCLDESDKIIINESTQSVLFEHVDQFLNDR